MASGRIPVETANTYIDGNIIWSSTTNVNNNTSTVTAELRLRRNNTGYTTYGTGTFTIVIDGNSKSNTQYYEITHNSNTLMVKHSVVVPHNDDGKKTITISAYGSIGGTTLSSSSASGKAVLDNIPRFRGVIAVGSKWREFTEGYIVVSGKWRQIIGAYVVVGGKYRQVS